jgi:hypothetical protein
LEFPYPKEFAGCIGPFRKTPSRFLVASGARTATEVQIRAYLFATVQETKSWFLFKAMFDQMRPIPGFREFIRAVLLIAVAKSFTDE